MPMCQELETIFPLIESPLKKIKKKDQNIQKLVVYWFYSYFGLFFDCASFWRIISASLM